MLTADQKVQLHAAFQANPAIYANGDYQLSNEDIAAYYNTVDPSATKVWKPSVTIKELNSAINWPDMVALTQEKQLAYQSMIWANEIDMTDNQVRAGIAAIFGTGTATTVGITNVGRRDITRLELVFANAGTVRTVPLNVFGYQLTVDDVLNIK